MTVPSNLHQSVRVQSLPPGTADRVRLVVSETFGGGWEGFQRYIGEPDTFGCHEWRFQGELGFGGKLYLNRGVLYVSCYPADETPILRAAMAHVNSELQKVLDEFVSLLHPEEP